ncbi:MarR family winged helix-turn-helix transcriptional regulator [Blastococcus sp. URHD0036]|uniref:MarR family winged helix-turn-helix transcriptional regulator n=1 Tax=Blastococcus sp. URHD0036 TaxID=1380356 RepID=UPI000497AE93|nr:MarR family transcriptional regulator [Blastococcus sp. URHD0036]
MAQASDEVDAVLDSWGTARPDIDPASIGVFGRIARLDLMRRAAVRRLHDRHGITTAAFDLLSQLRRAGPPHRRTIGELAEATLLTSAATTMRIDRLEVEGLVRRVRSDGDRRVVHAELTPAGLARIDAVYADHIALEDRLLAGLDTAERAQLVDLLRALGRSMSGVAAP